MDIIICAAFGLDTEKTQLVKEIQELKPHSDPSTIKNDEEFQFKAVSLNEELNALAIVGDSVAKVIKTPAPRVFHFLYRNLSSKWRKAFALASRAHDFAPTWHRTISPFGNGMDHSLITTAI